jgi:hypothetical protein
MAAERERQQMAERFAARLGLDPGALFRGAIAAWSQLNPPAADFDQALSLAGAVLTAAAAPDPAPATVPAEPGWVQFYAVQDNGDLLLTCHDPAAPGRDVTARVTQFELDTWLIASRPPGGKP